MSRFFNPNSPIMVILAKLFDYMLFSFLTLLCCLPVITVGAAFSALYSAIDRLTREDSCSVKEYFGAFGRCFKGATLSWAALAGAAALVIMDLGIASSMPPMLRILTLGGLFFMSLCILCTSMFYLPCQAHYAGMGLTKLWKKSFFLGVAKLPRTLLILLICAVPLLVYAFSPNTFIALLLFWAFFWPAGSIKLMYNLADPSCR